MQYLARVCAKYNAQYLEFKRTLNCVHFNRQRTLNHTADSTPRENMERLLHLSLIHTTIVPSRKERKRKKKKTREETEQPQNQTVAERKQPDNDGGRRSGGTTKRSRENGTERKKKKYAGTRTISFVGPYRIRRR